MRRKSIITIQKGEIECDALDIIILNGLAVGKKDGCLAIETKEPIKKIRDKILQMARVLDVSGRSAIITKALALELVKNPYLK